jgi:hypothetical protein
VKRHNSPEVGGGGLPGYRARADARLGLTGREEVETEGWRKQKEALYLLGNGLYWLCRKCSIIFIMEIKVVSDQILGRYSL